MTTTRDLRYGREIEEEYAEDPNNSLDYYERTPEEGRTFWVYVKYTSGAQSSRISKQYFIDVLPPSGSPAVNASWTINGSLVSWTSPSDFSVSGFDRAVVVRNIGSIIVNFFHIVTNDVSGSVIDSSAPENTPEVYYQVKWYNKAGNMVSATATSITTGSRNDSHVRLWISPEANRNGWNNSAVNVYWAMNTGGFDVAAWYYSINGGAWNNTGTSYVSVSDQGTNTVEVYASTADGIHSSTASIKFKIDTTAPSAPTITSLSQGEGDASSVTIVWSDGADAGSGLAFTEIWRSKSDSFATAERVGIVSVIQSIFWTPIWVDHTVENSTKYYYFLRHIDAADNPGTATASSWIIVESAQIRANKNYLDNSSFERLASDGNTLSNWSGSYSVVTSADGAATFHGTRSLRLSGGQSATQIGIPVIETINNGQKPFFLFSIYGRALSAGGVFITVVARDIDGTALKWAGGTGQEYCRLFNALPVQSTMTRNWYYGSSSIGRRWIIGPGTGVIYDYIGGSPYTNAGQLPDAATTLDITISASSGQIEVDAIMMEECDENGNQLENPLESQPSKYYDSRVINTDRINAVVGRFLELSANRITAGTLSSFDQKTYFNLNDSKIVLEKESTDVTTMSTSGIVRVYQGSTQYGTTKIYNNDVSIFGSYTSGTDYYNVGAQLPFTGTNLSAALGKVVGVGATLIGKVVDPAGDYTMYARPIGNNYHYYSSSSGPLCGHGRVTIQGASISGSFSYIAASSQFFTPMASGGSGIGSLLSQDYHTTSVPKFANGVYGSYDCYAWLSFWIEFAY